MTPFFRLGTFEVLKKGLDKECIIKSEYDAMNSEDKKAGRFYCKFKVHKEHDHHLSLDQLLVDQEALQKILDSL